MDYEDKKNHLSKMDETSLRKNVIVPLLRKNPRIQHVNDVHGPNENGVDIIYFEEDSLGIKVCVGVQLKAVSINLSDNGKSASFSDVQQQMQLADQNEHPLTQPVGRWRINKYLVMTSGKISDRARQELTKLSEKNYSYNAAFVDGGYIVDLIDRHWPEYWTFYNNTNADYYTSIRRRFGVIEDIVRLETSTTKYFDKVYVPVKLQEVLSDEEVKLKADAIIVKDPVVIDEVELLNREKLIMVIGESGSGKRLCLRKILFECLKRNETSKSTTVLPIVVDAKKILSNDDIIDTLKDSLQNNNGMHISNNLEELLARDETLILVDRLSRISTIVDIHAIVDKLRDLSLKFNKIRIICTVRTSGAFELAEYESFKRYQIMPFTDGQVIDLAINWFSENTKNLEVDVVVDQMIKNVVQGSLPRTPLVYTLSLVLTEKQQQVSGLADVFDKYIDLYLGKWDEELEIESQFDFNIKRSILGELAFEMLRQKVDCLSRNQIEDAFRHIFLRIGRKIDPTDIFEEIYRAGILVKENGHYRFALYAFQEWFSAYHLQRGNSEDFIIDNIDDRFWGQTIIFYSGLKKQCNNIIESLVTLKEEFDIPKQFYRSYLAGMIAVNADESDNKTKVSAIKYAFYGYILSLRKLSALMMKSMGQVGELHAGASLDIFAFYGLGSSKLAQQYLDLIEDENPISSNYVDGVPFSSTELALPKFLLASLMTRLNTEGHTHALSKVQKSNDPFILMLLYTRLNHMIDLNLQIEGGRDTRYLKTIRRDVKSKLDRNKEAVGKMLSRNRKMAKSSYVFPPIEVILRDPTRVLEQET